jgi:hypothetical protein
MVNNHNGGGFGSDVQIGKNGKLLLFVELHDVGPGFMSHSLPGHLHKGLGEEGKNSTLQN